MDAVGDIEDLFDSAPAKVSENLNGAKKGRKIIKRVAPKKKKIVEELEKVNNVIPGTQKIFVKTQGCSHNISDGEFMMGLLAEYGYELVDRLDDSDACLFNSCTVKNPSQDTFMFNVEKARALGKPVVVSGCVPQGDRNLKGLEGVSIIGITQIDRVVEVMEETIKGNTVRLLAKKELPSLDLPKIRKNKLLEIIPLSTGCLNSCTYCKTKHARGKLGSYAPEAIVARAQQGIDEGVREVWLTSEDTGAYGKDILEHLDAIADILNHPRMFAFLHIPVQSGSNPVLLNMNREYTVEDFKKVCDHLYERVPNLTIATDVICGFPYETTEQFEETLDLIDHYKFPVVNISKFYSRPGTEAAKWKKVPLKEAKNRSTKLTHLFNGYNCYGNYINTIQRVWIFEDDIKNDEMVVGHTKGYVKVLIKKKPDMEMLGQQVIVKIVSTHKWHIVGEAINYEPEAELVDEKYFEK
jgi:threonylcarbamoyladenosine tRNA methylthiotransferase CDKAL1